METINYWHFNNLDIIDSFVGCKRKFICQKVLVTEYLVNNPYHSQTDGLSHIGTKSMELSILYFKSLSVKFL